MHRFQAVFHGWCQALLVTIGISACGGESSNIPPSPPDFSDSDLRIAAGPRQLIFEWDEVAGATHYRLFENPDGASGFTQIGEDIPVGGFPAALEVIVDEGLYTAALDIAVHLFDWVNARYRLESCNALDECTLVGEQAPIGLSASAIQFLKTTSGFQAGFGYSLALSADGRTLASGAIGDLTAVFNQDGNPAIECYENGDAILFDEDGNRFDEEGNLVFVDDDGNFVDENGDPVDFQIFPCPISQSSGTTVVLDLDAGDGFVEAFVKAPNFDDFDAFGAATALSADGSWLVVSATGEDGMFPNGLSNNDAESAGAVYVYKRDAEGNWPAPGEGGDYLKASTIEAEDFFGAAVAISGDGTTIAVSAIAEASDATGINGDESNNDLNDAGAVYVFRAFFGNWIQEAYIKASNTDADDLFGFSLALDETGDLLIVGAPGESAADASDQSDNSKTGSGAVYVFSRDGSDWSQQTYLKASNADAARNAGDTLGDAFGASVSVTADGTSLLVGAPNEDGSSLGIDGDKSDNSRRNSGAAYLFTREGDTWTEQTYFKASNTGDLDEFGTTVRISGDGDSAVITAQRESSSATGINGTENTDSLVASGAAYRFEFSGGIWQQTAYIKPPVRNFGMQFGWRAEVSDDGGVLAISTPFEDSITTDSGAVFVY